MDIPGIKERWEGTRTITESHIKWLRLKLSHTGVWKEKFPTHLGANSIEFCEKFKAAPNCNATAWLRCICYMFSLHTYRIYMVIFKFKESIISIS